MWFQMKREKGSDQSPCPTPKMDSEQVEKGLEGLEVFTQKLRTGRQAGWWLEDLRWGSLLYVSLTTRTQSWRTTHDGSHALSLSLVYKARARLYD